MASGWLTLIIYWLLVLACRQMKIVKEELDKHGPQKFHHFWLDDSGACGHMSLPFS
jgi:hypothetical protein